MRLIWPLSTAICHIRKGRVVIRSGVVPDARDLLPRSPVDSREIRVALRGGVHLGDFQAVGKPEEMRKDFDAADHGDVISTALQGIRLCKRKRTLERCGCQGTRMTESGVAGDDDVS